MNESIYVEGVVVTLTEEPIFVDYHDNHGMLNRSAYKGIKIRSMSVCDLLTGRTIENLPAAQDCNCGDTVLIKVEVIKRKSRDVSSGLHGIEDRKPSG